MTGIPALSQEYAAAVPRLSVPWRARPVASPELVALDEGLVEELGLDVAWLRSEEGVRFLAGQVPEDMPTVAEAYAGHQFGVYSPRLGDGRALLLGELRAPDGRIVDLHLKGSGRTPFSRGGDGLAALGPMLRELLVGAALHAQGIPTTRALAVVRTGEDVWREGGPQPGAILCRVASSHLRVGTFQYAASMGEQGPLAELAAYAVRRHAPEAASAEVPALALLEHVVAVQAELVAQWMLAGFVHGVMNTDNMAISGESIDFGPCAFLDAYDPDAVFSSIDTGGRYRFGNQPAAAMWNLARFAESLLPLMAADPRDAVEPALAAVRAFEPAYTAAFSAGLARKLGLSASDDELQLELLGAMAATRMDWTAWLRALAEDREGELLDSRAVDSTGEGVGRLRAWISRWEATLPEGRDAARPAMLAANPAIIPRNDRVEAALEAAAEGDLGPFERLLAAVSSPYEVRAGDEDLAAPPPADAPPVVTFCGT